MESFIPGKSVGLGIDEQSGSEEYNERGEVESFASQTYILARLIDLKVHKMPLREGLNELKYG
jgi:hypothetical protein